MFVDTLKMPNEARLNQILHTLAHVHNFVLDQQDPQQLRDLQEHYTAEQKAIVESSAFNSYHANPQYVKASLITEAVRLLFEIAPKRRKKPVSESTVHKEPHMTTLNEKAAAKRKPDFLDVDKDGNRKEPMVKALKDKEKAHKLDEKWGTKMKTAPKDVGKWDGYTIAELKARKQKLMAKDERTEKEQKEVRQINFAIRAKQKDSWGKIKKESVIMEDQNLDQAETLLAAKDLSDQLQGMAEDAAKMAVDKLMPLVDTMKAQFGQPAAEGFNSVVKDNLQKVLDTIIAAKDQTDNAILTLQGGGTPSITADISEPLPGEQPMMPPEGEPGPDSEIDFEKEFDAMPATSGPEQEPLGRAKKPELAEADESHVDHIKTMAQTGKDKQGRPLTGQQKMAAKRAADELAKANIKEDKKAKSPYAVGMAKAMELTGDKPPLKKSTIKKAHEIARSIEKDLEEQINIQELDAVVETLKQEFHSLREQFAQHQKQHQKMINEGRMIDPLGTGYGLEGTALLQKMRTVKSRIMEAVKHKQQAQQKLNEAALLKNSIENKVSNLDRQLTTTPYGVVGVDVNNQKVKKFFESDKHRQVWLQYNASTLKEHVLVDPHMIKSVQQKLKQRI